MKKFNQAKADKYTSRIKKLMRKQKWLKSQIRIMYCNSELFEKQKCLDNESEIKRLDTKIDSYRAVVRSIYNCEEMLLQTGN